MTCYRRILKVCRKDTATRSFQEKWNDICHSRSDKAIESWNWSGTSAEERSTIDNDAGNAHWVGFTERDNWWHRRFMYLHNASSSLATNEWMEENHQPQQSKHVTNSHSHKKKINMTCLWMSNCSVVCRWKIQCQHWRSGWCGVRNETKHYTPSLSTSHVTQWTGETAAWWCMSILSAVFSCRVACFLNFLKIFHCLVLQSKKLKHL